MLTRLKVDGFKNLDGVDLQLGPFTCIAGPNGVGKSNLFDAISFLSALASMPLLEAAATVRGGEALRGDVASLFHRSGDRVSDRMDFLVEFLIPAAGEDALGQRAEASMTFLRYELRLRHRHDPLLRQLGTLEVVHETLVHINRSDAKAHLPFPHSKAWRESTVLGRRTSPYISTDETSNPRKIALHADSEGGLGGGRPRWVPAPSLPRTMLSSVNNAAEHRTVVLARQEMMGWLHLQLEPSALRAPDGLSSPRNMSSNGAHLPATLQGLAVAAERARTGGATDLYARIANRLSQLVEDVRSIVVDRDEKRQLFSILMTDRHGTRHAASALSDGTLRFLALTVMEENPESGRVVCLEEPENGMHPLRVPAVLQLLADLSVDVYEPVGLENPLRQVIINTHAPVVVANVSDEALLVARARHVKVGDHTQVALQLRGLPGTWRAKGIEKTVTKSELLAYLNPISGPEGASTRHLPGSLRRVADREEFQLSLLGFAAEPTP